MSSKKKKNPTAVRYTQEQKLEVVNYIDDYNAKHGRGGQSAAAKKFKVTPITISKWTKELSGVKKAAKSTSVSKSKSKSAAQPKAFGVKQRGARYTVEQKSQVVDFVNEYNAKHGRGGQSHAAKKFGLSVLTVSSWIKSPYIAGSVSSSSSASVPAGLNAKFAALIETSDELRKAEAETARLRAKYDALRASIQALI